MAVRSTIVLREKNRTGRGPFIAATLRPNSFECRRFIAEFLGAFNMPQRACKRKQTLTIHLALVADALGEGPCPLAGDVNDVRIAGDLVEQGHEPLRFRKK